MRFAALAVGLVAVLTLGACSSTGPDYDPYPGGGDFGEYVGVGFKAQGRNFAKAGDTLVYNFLHTNCSYPPYDTWGGTLERDFTNINKTWDYHLWNYDWDDAANDR